MRSLPRRTTVGCSEKSTLLLSPYLNTLSVVVRVCIRKPVNKRFSADFAKWNISDASLGTEELGHLEIVGSLVSQLSKCAPPKEWTEMGSWEYYSDNGASVYPQSSQGSPFNAASIAVTGDPLTNLYEDLAAEQKARAVYDNILRLSDDPDVNEVIKFLRQREVVHFQRFGEALDKMQSKLQQKKVMGTGIKQKCDTCSQK